MSNAVPNAPGAPLREPLPRVLGRYTIGSKGPTLLVTAAMHGNEPAGVIAAQRVLARLAELKPPIRGEFVALAGNIAAHREHRRYLTKDLNRQWLPEQIARLRHQKPETVDNPEERELKELVEHFDDIFARARGHVYYVDMHTTSAPGVPFACLGDTLRNRQFARHFPLPKIFGLEETLDGAVLEWVNNQGHTTFGIEAGQHDDPASADHHEEALWIALVASGCIAAKHLPFYEEMRRKLAAATDGVPSFVEIRYRHSITEADQFKMKPGYKNFQRIERGEELASDKTGNVRARERGCILMPLYQGLGNDGFFIGRRVAPFWLQLSSLLRRMRADRVAPILPGVQRHPERKESLIVNPRIARWFTYEVFHLLGYRKQRPMGDLLVVTRRRFDFPPRAAH